MKLGLWPTAWFSSACVPTMKEWLTMISDLRYAWRMLTQSPGFAAIAVLTLALGIGANTAVFSIVDGVLLRPLPYSEADRLVMVLDRNLKAPQLVKGFSSYADVKEYTAGSQSFERFAGIGWGTAGTVLTGRGAARNVVVNLVTADFFGILGIAPALGRTFSNDDLQNGCSVVLSAAFWRGTLGGDPRISGQSLTLRNRVCTVRGVMPDSFEVYPRQTEVWMLLTPDHPQLSGKLLMVGIGRLKRGITRAQAQPELASLHQSIHRGDWEQDSTPVVDPLQEEFLFLAGRNLRATLWVLLAAVGAVLLIACVNVANLMLGRLAIRERELAIRAALGSGRFRLVRQLLTEGLLLAAIGGTVGVWIGYGALRYFKYANPIELPVGADIALNLPVLAFTAALSIATSVIFGIAPAFTASIKDVNVRLSSAGRGATGASGKTSRWLIAVEMALSVALLAVGALLIQSMFKMAGAPLGFEPEHLTIGDVILPTDRYAAPERRVAFWDELRRRLNALPGVEGAAAATQPPPYGLGNYKFDVDGGARKDIYDTGLNQVSPEYFRVMKIAVLGGRIFDEHDRPGSEPVGVVNQALVREYFGNQNPIGARVRVVGLKPAEWVTVVGTVADEKRAELLHEMSWHGQPTLYRPLAQQQEPVNSAILLVRSSGLSAGTFPQTVAAIDPGVPMGRVASMQDVLGLNLKYPRFRAIVIGVFASVALLLAAVGLFGLLAQFVAQRTKEIGIRMAIGARPRNVVSLIARQAGVPVVTGLAIGFALLAGFTRYLQALLYGVRPADPSILAGVSLTLAAIAVIAIAVPARRAIRINPVVALRSE